MGGGAAETTQAGGGEGGEGEEGGQGEGEDGGALPGPGAGQGRGGREEWAGEVDVEHVVFVCGLFKMV